MSEEKKVIMGEEELGGIAGGMTRNMQAAYDVYNGKYGNGAERKAKLTAAGYDYETVQRLVNGLVAGYDKVAKDVINGKYGNGADRVARLRRAGYPPETIQNLVNNLLL